MAIMFLLLATGCASIHPKEGLLLTSVKGPYMVGDDQVKVSKTGESCAQMILGLVTFGDASIASAKSNGGISKVSSVDYDFFSVLGPVYQKNCTLVSGE